VRVRRRAVRRAAADRVVDAAQDLIDGHIAVAVDVEGRACTQCCRTQRDVHADDQRRDGDLAITIAVTSARSQRWPRDGEHQRNEHPLPPCPSIAPLV
jgi:hypothetical protein